MKENLFLKCLTITIYEDKADEYEVFIPETMIIRYIDAPGKLGYRIISSVKRRISSEVHSTVSFYIRHHVGININTKMCEIATEEFIDLANDEMNMVLGTAILVGYQLTFTNSNDFPIFGKGTLTSIKDPYNEVDQSKKEMEELDEAISADIDKAYNNLLLKIYERLATTSAVDSWSCSKLKTASDVVSERKLKLLQEEENRYSQFCIPCSRDDIRITETDMEYHIHIPEKAIAGPTYPVMHVENLDYMLGSVLRSNINTFFPIRHEHIRFTTTYNDTKNGNIIEAPLFRIKTHDVLGYFGYDENPQPYDKHSVGVLSSLIRRAYNNLYSSIRTVEIHDIDS